MAKSSAKRRPPRPSRPDDPFFTLLREGTQALQGGETARAIEILERAHRLNPGHGDAVLNLAGAYILAKRFKQAVALLEPWTAREPDNPMVWTNLGAAYLGNPILAGDDQQRQAIAAFERAYSLNPATPHVAYNLGLIYRDRQERDLALLWFRRAIQADPNDRDARNFIDQLNKEP